MLSLDDFMTMAAESSHFETAGLIPEAVKGLFEKPNKPYTLESARTDLSIISALNENPDIEKDSLLRKLEVDEKSEISDRIDLFLNRRNVVRETYEKYETPAQLYTGLFGQPPKGEIQVARGALAVEVVCFDESDYQYVAGASYSNKPRGAISINHGGCLIKNCREPSLDMSVICAKSNDLLLKTESENDLINTENVLNHENQHVINWLVNNPEQTHIAVNFLDPEDFLDQIRNLPDLQFAAKAREYAACCRELVLEYGLKDEFGAYLAQSYTPAQAYNSITENYGHIKYFADGLKEKAKTLSADQAFLWRGIADNAFADYDKTSIEFWEKSQGLVRQKRVTNTELAMVLANTHLRQFLNS